MYHPPRFGRRANLAKIVPPALLLLLTQSLGCGGGSSDPAAALSAEFPQHAPKVLGSGRGFSRASGRYLPAAPPRDLRPTRSSGRFHDRLQVELPESGAGDIVLRTEGFEARVREEGMDGAPTEIDRSVIYEREGGASFWTTAPGGVEEWLHLAPARVTRDRPAATWHVKGAQIRPRGTAVELVGVDGRARVVVVAPIAYAAGGREIKTELRARAGDVESDIELYVDAKDEAVLVDPIWMATTNMSTPRANHAAALVGYPWGPWELTSVTGGTDGVATALSSHTIYDPYADQWYDDLNMSTPRTCHTATTLPDGTELIVGGMDDTGFILDSSELYDWWDSQWSNEGGPGFSRMNHTATLMQNGEVLVVGGKGDWTAVASATQGQPSSPQVLGVGLNCWNVPNGSGGSGSGGPGTTAFVDVFSQGEGNFWYSTSSLWYPRERHTATLLQNGGVLVVGGEDEGFVHNTSETYHGYFWGGPEAMTSAREDHTATLLNDGSVLVTGGSDGAGALATAEIYTPPAGSGGSGGGGGVWMVTAPMSTPRMHHTAALLPDGTVIVAGGTDGTTALATAEIYDPVTQSWSPALPMNQARTEATGTMMPNGGWVVAGGVDETDSATPTADIYWYLYPLGFPCTAGSQCASGYCVEGVCCESECSDICYTCRGQGGGDVNELKSASFGPTMIGIAPNGDGYCHTADWGTNPRNDCADTGVENCGQSGLCDGEGSCMLYQYEDICVPAYCDGNVAVYDAYCDGEGLCRPPSNTEDCAEGRCDTGYCYFDCETDADCSATGWCNDGGCSPKLPDGQPTSNDNECLSGVSADGVCCDTACMGECVACTSALKGGGLDGVCGPIKSGTDPDGECPAQAASTCGVAGSCDGQGACARYPAGTICSPSSCAGSTLVQADLCDGAGHCVDSGNVNCAPNLCAGGTCLSSCTADPECTATAYCNGNQCAPKAPLGSPATAPNECLSGFMADGICCDTACAGGCTACTALKKGGGVDGTCGPIAKGTDPDAECNNTGVGSCGTNGVCDGLGACELYPSGTVCDPASCSGTTLTQSGLCDGSGTCVAGSTVECAPAKCAAGTCQTSCSNDSDCVSSGYCAVGTCAAKKQTGGNATAPNECLSGFVADGVCCDTACVGTCLACSAAKKGSGSDGTCGPIVNGADPDHECGALGPSTCGISGSCNGVGACALYPAGTVCSPTTCSGTTLVQPSLCDGNGTCVAGGTVDCAPAACNSGTCGSSCSNDTDCVATGYCGPSSVCVTKKGNGEAATAPNECLSGFMADGICCDTACAGTCVACTATKKGIGADGTCGPISGGMDPDDECADDGPTSCGHNGSCSGQGACDFYPSGIVCGAASCQGNTAVHADTCDGAGSCVDAGVQNCGLAACLGGVCATSCEVDEDCSTAVAYCDSASLCAPKKAVGEAATGDNQCLTGFLADGVCCESACAAGPCDACSVAAGSTADGVCAPLNGAACDDGDKCTLVDACQGSVCVGASPVICESTDQCKDPGTCDPISGACSLVPKPNGTTCDDGKSCTVDSCQSGECKGLSKLDGTPCEGGICIAGGCLLDPTVGDAGSSSSSSGAGGNATGTTTITLTTAPPGTGGNGGAGGNGDFSEDKLPSLVGGGCLSVGPVEDRPSGAAPVGLLLGLLAMLRRRTSRDRAR